MNILKLKQQKITPVVEIRNLYTSFNHIYIHKNLQLELYPNRIITLIGDSGCGKTTLVREILALQVPDSGNILINGNPIADFNIENPETKLMLSKLGMMFQHGALFSSVSVLENVMYPLIEYTNFSKKTIQELAELKLTLTGLPSSAFNKHINELSGGMLKRVALARTIVLDPYIIFLDEPTAGLDPNSADALDELIKELQRQLSLTVVMITHDLNSIWNISDELIYMGDKKILLHDTVINAANNTKLPNLYQYFNGKRGVITKAFYTRDKNGTNI